MPKRFFRQALRFAVKAVATASSNAGRFAHEGTRRYTYDGWKSCFLVLELSMLPPARATQPRRARWRGFQPSQNLIGPDRPAVIAEIRIPLRSYYCAFQGYAGEETLALAVGVNSSGWCDCARRSAAYWSCRSTDVSANRHVASSGKRSHGSVIVKDDHEIGYLRADLKSPSRAAGGDKRWAGPAMICASDHDALATFGAKNKSGFDDGHDREPFGMSKHVSRDSSFWHLSEIADDRSAVVDSALFCRASGDE